MVNIRSQKLLYHLTAIENLSSILDFGLLPRSQVANFLDVADSEILANRSRLRLEDFVPFHFFSRNPFDGRVQADHRGRKFILISVLRSFALSKNWKIVPCHPLANQNIQLLDYEDGFNKIDWEVMNVRDYHDPHCKSVCMAECLSPTSVMPASFFKIFVPSDDVKAYVEMKVRNKNFHTEVSVNGNMFLS